MSLWQKSLRRYDTVDAVVEAKDRRRSYPSPSPFDEAGVKKARKLSVVDEDAIHLFELGPKRRESKDYENTKRPSRVEPRRSSVVPKDPVMVKETMDAAKKRPTKQRSKLPKVAPLTLSIIKHNREPLVSPIPLPEGVECIDPSDDANLECWPEFIKYSKEVEKQWIFTEKEIIGKETELVSLRTTLMEWIVEVITYFHASQETLYHTVRFIDATLAKRRVTSDKVQLVGITAVLIAAKLEEYSAPTLESLLELTENSYSTEELLKMERRLLRVLDFELYAPEPMLFLNRFIRAAFREDDALFRHTCLLFIDATILSIEYSQMVSSLKAASAVLAALLVSADIGSSPSDVWTPTLRYHTGYSLEAIVTTTDKMFSHLLPYLEKQTLETPRKGIAKKFSSNSRHSNIIKKLFFNKAAVLSAHSSVQVFLQEAMME